jgi:ribosomal-protein-alanine N-acetyltransferase
MSDSEGEGDILSTRILTDRVILRAPILDDAAAITRLMTSDISRWLASWPTPATLEDTEQKIATAQIEMERGTGLTFILERALDAATIGWTTIHDHGDGRANLSYWIGTAFQSRGYGVEAVPAAVEAGFALLDIETMEAGVQMENAPSLVLIRELGMRPIGERTIHAPARNRDEQRHIYAISRREFFRKHGGR